MLRKDSTPPMKNPPPGRASSTSTGRRPGFWTVTRQTLSAWSADNCMELAAALACYALLSLAPLIVILFRVLHIVLENDQAQQMLTRQLQNLLGQGANAQLIQTILHSSKQNSGALATIISIVILIFGASGVFSQLQQSMNRIWRVQPNPKSALWGWMRARFLSMSVMLGLGFLLLVSFFVSTIITTFARSLLGNATWVGIVLEVALSLAVITLLLAAMFKWLPDVQIRWEDVWLGAFTTAILFVAGKWGLTLYFEYGAPTSAYGVFGSVVAVVIWVYYAAQILYLGAEFTKVHARVNGHPVEPDRHAKPLDAVPARPAGKSQA